MKFLSFGALESWPLLSENQLSCPLLPPLHFWVLREAHLHLTVLKAPMTKRMWLSHPMTFLHRKMATTKLLRNPI